LLKKPFIKNVGVKTLDFIDGMKTPTSIETAKHDINQCVAIAYSGSQ
jgi:hypothetical protein